MSRPKQNRKIANPPIMKGFKPFGIPRKMLNEVTLLFDEYEAIRLVDYEGLHHEKAAKQMNVSRPTLTRIYDQARKTIALALVEGKMINIEGGNVEFDREWYRCRRCYKLIGGIENHIRCKDCNTYGNDELIPINTEEE
ncbi:MAG: DUF134 domain-containing protein [Fermentimonas sp.]|nr:DUF134 domain-containing protein [Fermentimonas sp.]MDD4438385.1 DUF134 domain-containing protein [Tissierellia bacterium]